MPAETQSWPKIGNDKAVEFLSRVISGGQVAQSYLFVGPEDLGKATIALTFAHHLMASVNTEGERPNSDLHILQREEGKKSISIEKIRELIKTLSLSSFLDSYKIGIIREADTLTIEAQNALLKTLEEPREKIVLILLAKSEDNLLPTILSRVQKLYFQPVKAEIIYDYLLQEHGAQRSLAKDLANISLGRPLKAVRMLEDPGLYDSYLVKARLILSSFRLGLNARLENLNSLFNDRTYSAGAIDGAEEVIGILEGLLRDLFLLEYNQPEKLQHSSLKAELEVLWHDLKPLGAKEGDFVAFLLGKFKLTAMAREYLAASVNPRLVLEQLFINL